MDQNQNIYIICAINLEKKKIESNNRSGIATPITQSWALIKISLCSQNACACLRVTDVGAAYKYLKQT